MSRIGKSIETESRLVVSKVPANGYKASFWDDEKYLQLDSGDFCKILWIY